MCISLSGALLIGQAAAIAWLVQQVLVERVPLASGLPVLAGLAVILVLRTLLGSATRRPPAMWPMPHGWPCVNACSPACSAMDRCGCASAAPANWAN